MAGDRLNHEEIYRDMSCPHVHTGTITLPYCSLPQYQSMHLLSRNSKTWKIFEGSREEDI